MTLFCPPETFPFRDRRNSSVNSVELLPESIRKDSLLPSIESSTAKKATRPPKVTVSSGSVVGSFPFHVTAGGDHRFRLSVTGGDAHDARTTARVPARMSLMARIMFMPPVVGIPNWENEE